MWSLQIKNSVVPVLLRLALAAIFIYHGSALVGGPDNEWGAHWAKFENAPPQAAQLAVAWGELLGGIALGLGFLTRLAAVGIIVIMAGAIATVHWPHGFDITKGGFEYNFAIIMMCLALLLGGPGPVSSDRLLFRRRSAVPDHVHQEVGA
jgi:putative oxidoreductase